MKKWNLMQSRDIIRDADVYIEMFEALPVAVALTDLNGIVVYANKEMSSLCDVKHFQLKNIFIGCLFDKQDSILNAIQDIRNKHCTEWRENCSIQVSSICAEVVVKEVAGLMCFTILPRQAESSADMSPREELFKRENDILNARVANLANRNRELIRSNQDLSQYAYVASHDLQEPLRKIRVFSDMLLSCPEISGNERFIARKIHMASERMSSLIQDLLNYSKLLKAETVFEKVNLSEIFKAVLVDFEIKIQESGAQIQCAELPEIQAVKLQMNQLFYNLLGNALKFTSPGEPPIIEITASEIDSRAAGKFIEHPHPGIAYIHIRFKDHGIGFQGKDSEEIFEVFKRLYPREVYEGSGIGLALCRRIVQNHGGCLYAKSAPGEGAAFNIIVPHDQPRLRA